MKLLAFVSMVLLLGACQTAPAAKKTKATDAGSTPFNPDYPYPDYPANDSGTNPPATSNANCVTAGFTFGTDKTSALAAGTMRIGYENAEGFVNVEMVAKLNGSAASRSGFNVVQAADNSGKYWWYFSYTLTSGTLTLAFYKNCTSSDITSCTQVASCSATVP